MNTSTASGPATFRPFLPAYPPHLSGHSSMPTPYYHNFPYPCPYTYPIMNMEEVQQPQSSDEEESPGSSVDSSPYHCSSSGKTPLREVASPPSADVPSVSLTEKDLWKSFYAAGNEMIVTKPGRRLFPTIVVSVSNLKQHLLYTVKIRFTPADKYRHKFISGRWTAVSESDIIQDESAMVYTHPTSPNNGEYWMKKPISFKSIKITHHIDSKNGNILLHTMHKYRIEIIIMTHKSSIPDMIFPLANSDFIAVTSYQSSDITKLKVDNNPFAKGFREQEGYMGQRLGRYTATIPQISSFYSPPFFPPPLYLPPPLPSIHQLVNSGNNGNSQKASSYDGSDSASPSTSSNSPLTPSDL